MGLPFGERSTLGDSGRAVDSIGGILFRVDRAIDLRRDRLMPLRADLLAIGTGLAVVRILDLPRIPELEARGMVRHSDLRGDGLVVGLSFEAMGGLEAWIASGACPW
jgi:hypothetical protein